MNYKILVDVMFGMLIFVNLNSNEVVYFVLWYIGMNGGIIRYWGKYW